MSDEIIIESIKKLLALKMPDDEIIGSLIDAGVDYDTAQELLDEVKGKKRKDRPKSEKKEVVMPKKSAEVKDIEDIDDDVTKEEKSTDEEVKNIETTSLGIWQEGLLTTVNQKLELIEEKEKELDKNIDIKVKAITEDEIKKMKIILDSQRTLLISKINSTLDLQVKAITEKIDATIKTMQDVNKQTQSQLSEINDAKDKINDIQKSLLDQLDEFNKIRDSTNELVDQMKTKLNTDTQKFFDNYNEKYKGIDEKLHSAISLTTKIVEGLVTATKKKIDDYYDSKYDNFIKEFGNKINTEDFLKEQKDSAIKIFEDKEKQIEQNTLNKIDDFLRKLNEIDQKIAVINEIKNHIEDTISIKVDDFLAKKELGKESVNQSITDLNKRIAELENRIKLIKPKKDDLSQDINQTLEEMILFKEQYAKLVTKLMQDVKQLKEQKKTKK